MPEVPQNMQEDLQRMELEAGQQPRNNVAAPNTQPQSQPVPAASAPGQATTDFKPFKDTKTHYQNMSDQFEGPNFSPFPKVKGDNVPPSDEEKEEILYNAREHVLNSNNVSMQLSWARDALSWVEIAAEAHMRENGGQMARPQTPKVEHELRHDAIQIVEYISQQSHPEALFMRAKWLEFGKFGFRMDKKEAYKGYKKAAEQANGRAEYRMGMLYENTNEMDQALKHYNLGLGLKDSAASYRLGMMSLTGQHGQRKDFQKGLELIQAAADSADEDAPQGAYVYGMLIARDLPDISMPEGMLPYDVNVARQYIEKAAYLGFAKAQLKMGQAYELCQLGCDFNPAYSLHYYGLAARQGQPEAALGVSRWFLFGYEGVFQKNEQLAYKYAMQAADAKLPTGEFAIGYYNEIGIHVQKNLRDARTWYEKAAEHGNDDAKGRLAQLDQSKTLTKKDHETTALSRIKSQHGSQRGRKPDRFKQKESAMPTLQESAPSTPVDAPLPKLPLKGASPRQSPQVKPVADSYDMPEHGRHPSMGNSRVPAFTVNLDQNLAMRPKSAAPYPVDDRPPPLNLNRPQSVAPYPEDDMRRPVSPHFNPSIRPSSGPQADRPMSAFGIRPQSYAPPQSQSTSNLIPPAASQPPRGRVQSAGWDQGAGGYRQPSPGRVGGTPAPYPPYDAGQQRVPMGSAPQGGPPVVDPTRNRLSKTNPNPGPSQYPPQQPQHPYAMSGAQQPGRDYAAPGGRPMSDVYGAPGGHPPRIDSAPMQGGHARLPSQGQLLKDRPGMMDPMAGRQSAPPMQHASGPRPGSVAPFSPAAVGQQHGGPGRHGSPALSVQSPPPKHQPTGQGPATFEQMGIPPGKSESDCVSLVLAGGYRD
jgi:TPR repeat protein